MTTTSPTRDFTHVTETPGRRITREALSMMLTRYDLAARHVEGGDVSGRKSLAPTRTLESPSGGVVGWATGNQFLVI